MVHGTRAPQTSPHEFKISFIMVPMHFFLALIFSFQVESGGECNCRQLRHRGRALLRSSEILIAQRKDFGAPWAHGAPPMSKFIELRVH